MTTPTKRAAKTAGGGQVLEALRALLADGRDDDVLQVVEKLVSRNEQLEQLIARMRSAKNHGEQLSREQLDLFLDELKKSAEGELAEANRSLEAAAEAQKGRPERTAPPRQPPVRKPPPPELRRVENPLPVPPAERACPGCGAERTCIHHEITEVIDLIPAEVIVRRDSREILACGKCDGQVARAPMGDKVVTGGAYGSALVGQLVVDKYTDALPLNRQQERIERLGLRIPSSSMGDQITWATDLLRPLWEELKRKVLCSKVMHVDGTSLPVRDRESIEGIITGALWGYVGGKDAAVYLYTSTGKRVGQRPGEIGPAEFLALRHGYVVADAANLFDRSFAAGSCVEVGCNMHSRRYFVKALEAGDVRAAVPLKAFQTLYDVEDSAREMEDGARREERQRRSKPVYDELAKWCTTYQPLEPPSSLMGKAVNYLLNHQTALTRFLGDGGLPIDNGIVERLHRRPAVGRRNYLFAGSHAGAERAAIAYSVLGTCALLDVNPVQYLADVLPRLARGIVIARDVPQMLPAAWKAARVALA